MPCRLRLITFGWSPEFVYRHVIKLPPSFGDMKEAIALVVPEPQDQYSKGKFEEALSELKRFLSSIGYSGDLEVLALDPLAEPLLALSKILNYILSKNCEEVIIDVSGGLRLHNVVLTMLAMFLSGVLEVRLLVGLEIMPRLYEVPLEALKLLKGLSRVHYEVLKLVSDRELNAIDVSKHIGKDISYVRKILKQLTEAHTVEKIRRGRVSFFKASELGLIAMLFLELKLRDFHGKRTRFPLH